MPDAQVDPAIARPASQPVHGVAALHMNVGLRVSLDGAPFFERDWLESIPRRLV
jgi:hypothetical protein